MQTTVLGQPAVQPASPEEARLDPVPNPHRDVDYVTRFVCPEFTSLCPVTGQPDFAHLVIDYVPDELIVEFEVAEAVPDLVPQPRRVPRGMHGRDRQANCRDNPAALAAHRRLLVPARRHPD